MNDENQIEMPRYKSHKEVHALKLEAIHHGHNAEGESTLDFCTLEPEDKAYAPIQVKSNWCTTKIVTDDVDDCGYLVVYADGYTSWSPTKAFEEGYDRI